MAVEDVDALNFEHAMDRLFDGFLADYSNATFARSFVGTCTRCDSQEPGVNCHISDGLA